MAKKYEDINGRVSGVRNGKNGGGILQRKDRGATADWIAVDPVLLQQAIAAWARHDGALRFGYTRDGGAYAIGVYGDGDPRTERFGPNDDIEGYLRDLIEAANALG